MVKKVWQTDRRTDRRTDGRTDWTSHIAAWSQLKKWFDFFCHGGALQICQYPFCFFILINLAIRVTYTGYLHDVCLCFIKSCSFLWKYKLKCFVPSTTPFSHEFTSISCPILIWQQISICVPPNIEVLCCCVSNTVEWYELYLIVVICLIHPYPSGFPH